MNRTFKALAVGLMGLLSATAQASPVTLVGGTAACTTSGKWSLILWCDAAAATIRSPTSEFELIWDYVLPAFRINIEADSIRVDLIAFNFNWPLGATGDGEVTLDGLDFGKGSVITGVTVVNGGVPVVSNDTVRFTPHSVTIDFSGTGMWLPGDHLDVALDHSPIPEPTSWGLAALALAGLGAHRRLRSLRS